jgi:hypothetical protein
LRERLRGQLGAHPVLGLAELGRELGSEFFRFEQLAQLQLRRAVAVEGRPTQNPLQRLLPGGHLDQRVTGDQFLRLGERPVDYGGLATRKLDPRPLRARVEAVAAAQDAGLHHLSHVLAHCGQQRFARHDAGFRLLVSFADNHKTHWSVSLSGQCGGGCGGGVFLSAFPAVVALHRIVVR